MKISAVTYDIGIYEMTSEMFISLSSSALANCKTFFPMQCDQKKNRQMSIKVTQKWFHQKMIDFANFTKIP